MKHNTNTNTGTDTGGSGTVPTTPIASIERSSADPEEAAAIVAAIERFMRATALRSSEAASPPDEWQRAAILEGVEREPQDDVRYPWINT